MTENNNFALGYRDHHDIKIIDISGHLDAYTANELEQALYDVIQQENYKIIVNFSKLEYISSAGLGVFMAFIEEVRNKDGDIKLSEMNSKVYSVFDLLGFPMLFDINKDEAKLIEKFRSNDSNDQK
jgi:anti-sigma B factor antagonist